MDTVVAVACVVSRQREHPHLHSFPTRRSSDLPIPMATARRNRSLLLSSPLAFLPRPLLWQLRAFANFFCRTMGPRHSLSSCWSSLSLLRNRCFARSADSDVPSTAPRSPPTPGIIAPTPLFRWPQPSGYPLRSLAAKNGNGRMIMLPCLPVPSSLRPGPVYSARHCGKFSIPRRAVKLSRVFDALHVQCLA